MRPIVDMSGKRCGRLVVIGRAASNSTRGLACWDCLCDCGVVLTASGSHLRNGNVRSCGCLQRTRHGASPRSGKTAEYQIWKAMRQRCSNPKSKDFKHYGGRGIQVCERWSDFKNFLADMGPRPSGYSIERKDNNAGYSPENCIWANRITQLQNTRRTRRPIVNGTAATIRDLADLSGLSYSRTAERLRRGDTPESILGASR